MRILISTTNRHVPFGEPSGYIFTYDFDKHDVIQKTLVNEPPYGDVNPNPRGGLRGQKGFCLFNEQLGIVNSSTMFVYDKNWKPLKYFFHPSCASNHEFAITQNSMWVTSTENDILMEFDHDGNYKDHIDFRTQMKALEATGWKTKPFLTASQIEKGSIDFRDPRTHNQVESDKAHINSVFALEDGSLLVSLGLLKNSNFSVLLNIKKKLTNMGIWKIFININNFLRKTVFKNVSENKGEMLIQAATGVSAVVKVHPNKKVELLYHFSGSSVPSHSIRRLEDGSAIYLNSSAGELINFDLHTGKTIFKEKLGSKFLRGARQLSDGTLVLGDGTHFIHYDLENRKVIDRIKFTDETPPSVFDFYELPNDFATPPASLIETHEKFMPLDQINMPA